MLDVERHKPVYQLIEERITLHLAKTSIEDIHTCLLHIRHPLYSLLHLLHSKLRLSRIKNIVERFILLH